MISKTIEWWRRGNVHKSGDFARPNQMVLDKMTVNASEILPEHWQLWLVGSCVTDLNQAQDIDWVTTGTVSDHQQLEQVQLALYNMAYCIYNQLLDLKHYEKNPADLIYLNSQKQIADPDCIYYFIPDVEFTGPGYHTRTDLTKHQMIQLTQYLYESNLMYSNINNKLIAEVTANNHRIRCRRLI